MNKRVKKNKKAVALLVALVVFLSLGGMAAAGQDWSNHWAGKQISCWLEKELITGYPDGSFQLTPLLAELNCLNQPAFRF